MVLFHQILLPPVTEMRARSKENEWPIKVEWGLIGSCTNSSYEDLSRAASIAQQAIDKNLTTKAEFGINPGSEQVRFTAERDGFLNIFENLNAKYLQMLAVLVSVSGQEKVLILKKKIQSYTHLIEISLKELTVILIHMHL